MVNKLINDLKGSEGAGDVVKAFTTAAGITPCAPCEKRREQMNNLLSWTPRLGRRLLTDSEITFIEQLNPESINNTEQLLKIYNEVFNEKIEYCDNCNDLLRTFLSKLLKQITKQKSLS